MGCPLLSMVLPVSIFDTFIDVGCPKSETASPQISLVDQVLICGINQRWFKKFDIGICGRQATARYARRAADSQSHRSGYHGQGAKEVD